MSRRIGLAALLLFVLAPVGQAQLFDPVTDGAGIYTAQSVPLQVLSTPGEIPVPLAGGGANLDTEDDKVSDPLPIGFDFPFYGHSFTELFVSTNGWLSFDMPAADGCCNGQTLPNAVDIDGEGDNMVAFMWTDVDPSVGGTITYQSGSGGFPFVLNFHQVDFHHDDLPMEVQVLLFPSGHIWINYIDSGLPSGDEDVSIGIENEDASIGLTYFFSADGQLSMPPDGQAVLIGTGGFPEFPGDRRDKTRTYTCNMSHVEPSDYQCTFGGNQGVKVIVCTGVVLEAGTRDPTVSVRLFLVPSVIPGAPLGFTGTSLAWVLDANFDFDTCTITFWVRGTAMLQNNDDAVVFINHSPGDTELLNAMFQGKGGNGQDIFTLDITRQSDFYFGSMPGGAPTPTPTATPTPDVMATPTPTPTAEPEDEGSPGVGAAAILALLAAAFVVRRR